MVTGGNVLPGAGTRIVYEVAIVNRVRMFIEHQPRLGGFRHLGLFEILFVLRKTPIKALGGGIVAKAETAEDGVHREAAVAQAESCVPLSRAEVVVGGASVCADGGGGVTDRKSTRLNSSHIQKSRMPSSA